MQLSASLRSASSWDMRNRHSGPRQQPAEEDHCQTDRALRLQEGTNRWDNTSQASLRGW